MGARTEELVQAGISALQASLLGFTSDYGISALGNDSQANGYQLSHAVNFFTTADATHNTAVFPKNLSYKEGFVFGVNVTGVSLNIYPYSGDNFNSVAANGKFTLPNNGVFLYFKGSNGLRWIGVAWT